MLDAIEQAGSISGAGRLLGLSYRRTWLMVSEMNRCFRDKLVETVIGGGSARGARLTEDGRRLRSAFRELEATAAAATNGCAYSYLVAALCEAPRSGA